MEIVPSLDIFAGKVVKLERGDPNQVKVYSTNPTYTLRHFVKAGAKLVHIVDLDGAIYGRNNLKIILDLIDEMKMGPSTCKLQIAGGIRTKEYAQKILDDDNLNVVKRIVIGSMAYENIDETFSLLRMFGKERVVIACDYDKNGSIVSRGWKKTESLSLLSAVMKFRSDGFRNFLLTSSERDGTLGGPDTERLRAVIHCLKKEEGDNCNKTGPYIIASGGIANETELSALEEIGVDEVVVGKAIYEGRVGLTKRVVL
jgi:phosphoribosylformimino-5-aminoimidazole carboxamide ribotide isomerase